MFVQQASWCLLMFTVAMVTEVTFSRGLKKRHYSEHHVAIDDSFDPDWSSMQSVDDVASWFDQLEQSDLDDNEKEDSLHHHEMVDTPSSMSTSTAATTTTTSTSSSTSQDRATPRRRNRGGSKHAAARSKQQLTTSTIRTTSSLPIVTPRTMASVTLGGIVDVVEHSEVEEVKETSIELSQKDEVGNFRVSEDQDPCRGVICRAGRVCRPPHSTSSPSSDRAVQGRCVCADADHCMSTNHGKHSHRSQQVCGSNGRWYPSHCELHRTACITGIHLGVDRTSASCSTIQPSTVDAESDKTSEEIEIEVVTVAPPTLTHAVNLNASELLEIETPRDCSKARFERMKTNLLSYHCARDTTFDCSSDADKKKYVVADMFDYYDWSGDNRLEPNEMISIEHRDHLERLSQHCRLEDILKFSDDDKDGFISMKEFYTSFGVEIDSEDKIPHIFRTTVSFGNSVELKCDSAAEDGVIIWKRNGNDVNDLQEHNVKVFADGSLYIGQLTLHHIGNYTCQNSKNDNIIQTHVLLVQMPPNVHVSPHSQHHLAGSTALLKCRANGLPTPDLSWQLDDTPLKFNGDDNGRRRYIFMHNNSSLEVKSWTDDDLSEASLKCVAKNSAGTSHDVGSVSLERESMKATYMASDSKETELVTVFHERGYTVYELNRCHVDHHVAGDFQPMPKVPTSASSQLGATVSSLCSTASNDSACVWADAVNVRGKFIYAAQPTLGRIIVIELVDRLNPVEVILTDSHPTSLHYVKHLDQVWVLCKSNDSHDAMVVMVIRDASETIVHRAVHIHPTSDSGFEKVNGLFLPNSNDLGYTSDIGYVIHSGKTSLQKLNLLSLMYTNDIDLSHHLCIPVNVVFLPIGGRVVISCASPDDVTIEPKQQLVLDFVTDKIIETIDVGGVIYVAPDVRNFVILGDNGNTISAYAIADDGTMTHTFDEQTELRLNHVTFFPSAASHGYSLFAASREHSTVLQLELASGKVQLIKGTELSTTNSSERAVIVSTSSQFAGHVITLTSNSVVVIDGARHHVDCVWQDVTSPRVVVPLELYG